VEMPTAVVLQFTLEVDTLLQHVTSAYLSVALVHLSGVKAKLSYMTP